MIVCTERKESYILKKRRIGEAEEEVENVLVGMNVDERSG
jgi:hypothetical protein